MTNRSAIRINRRHHSVRIETATTRDDDISFRALGLLTHILGHKEDWQVRSEQLARGKNREGRDAIRKALHELARFGYYRLERRRYLDGTQAMGTAVSEYPVKEWVEDYITFGCKLDVPVVEQEDGSFRVKYPDGTLGPDGFMPNLDDPDPSESAEEPQPTTEETPRKLPPAAARAKKGPKKKAEPKDDSAPPSNPPVQEPPKKEPKQRPPADQVATWYYEYATKHLGPYAGKQKSGWYMGLKNMTQQALDAGYTPREVAKAFQRTGLHFPSATQFQRALSDERNNKPMPSRYGGRPAPYSDAATWGPMATGEPPSTTTIYDPDDGADFGVVPA
ncbi:hypothetical protein QR97_02255 [Streptomyces sp. PBH53]|uniref:hypothetical protein n=1 Tax=Streptomyces sp. PBH53 TaxID=1577075 RepID=UPI000655E5ED|nr:hypothetical protein [Streptomyces sp. PBH53]AKN68780.1 hypothetical protein QR97_02255 [Streptomyces sp. PBH53]